jgi:hypothetical protein
MKHIGPQLKRHTAKGLYIMKKNPVLKIVVPMNERPRCIVDGCNKPGGHTGGYRVDGTPIFRKKCKEHHDADLILKNGGASLKEIRAKNLTEARTAGFDTYAEYERYMYQQRIIESGCETEEEYRNSLAIRRAQAAGFDNVIDYNNSRHRYRCNRLDHCQNSTGEAVWVDPDTGEHKPLHNVIGLCTYTIPFGENGKLTLSVDHINGNNLDDRPKNHQTLCLNCHRVKSHISKDNWSCEKKRKHLEKMATSLISQLVCS